MAPIATLSTFFHKQLWRRRKRVMLFWTYHNSYTNFYLDRPCSPDFNQTARRLPPWWWQHFSLSKSDPFKLYNYATVALLHSPRLKPLLHHTPLVTWPSFSVWRAMEIPIPKRTEANTLKMAAKNLVESRSFLIIWNKATYTTLAPISLTPSCTILHMSRDTVTWSSFSVGRAMEVTIPNRTKAHYQSPRKATTLKMAAKNRVESRSFLIIWDILHNLLLRFLLHTINVARITLSRSVFIAY